MAQETYRVTLSDGRIFEVQTEGGPPSEADVLAALKTKATPTEETTPSPAVPSPDSAVSPTPAGPSDTSGPPVGMLALTGAALQKVPGVVARSAAKVGRQLAHAKGGIVKAAGGTIGASLGGSLGATIGQPFGGASLGAYAGHRTAGKVGVPAIKKLGEYLTDIAAQRIPPASRRSLVHAMQRYGAKPLGRLVPGAGQALMAADVANLAWRLGRGADKATGERLSEAVESLPGAETVGRGLGAVLPDAWIREILAREGR